MDIRELIPQRDPFLFIDSIEINEDQTVTTKMNFSEEMDFFKGHFPDNPIVPGVILSEHCFQSGAALISSKSNGDFKNHLAVVTRINSAKFKKLVHPNQTIQTTTSIIEMIDNTAFMKSIVKNEDSKKVLIIEFACTLVKE